MKLTWFTTAAFTLREGETAIAFDPFLGLPLGKRWPDMSGSAFRDAAAVFVTHGHVDHILELPALTAGSKAPVYATGTPCRTLLKHGVSPDRLRRIRPGQTAEVGPFAVTAFRGAALPFRQTPDPADGLQPPALGAPAPGAAAAAVYDRIPGEGGDPVL